MLTSGAHVRSGAGHGTEDPLQGDTSLGQDSVCLLSGTFQFLAGHPGKVQDKHGDTRSGGHALGRRRVLPGNHRLPVNSRAMQR